MTADDAASWGAEAGERESRMSGHGHVYPNEDDSKARCGGPGICGVCSRELAAARQASHTATPGPKPAGRGSAGQGQDQDWHAKYLALGTAVSTYMQVCERVKHRVADGGEYWMAHNAMMKLVGEALCWRDIPEEYAAALARQQAARTAAVGQTGRDGQGE